MGWLRLVAPVVLGIELISRPAREVERQIELVVREDMHRERRTALLLLARHHSSSGGASETEVKEFAVTPTGVPSGRTPVTTVTPVANRPNASRNPRCVRAVLKRASQ